MTTGIARQPETRALNEVVRFVLARLDDDHRTLRRLTKQGVEPATLHRREIETEANREIVGLLQRLAILRDLPSEQSVRDAALQMLRAMAKPYCDHQAYQAHWN